MAMVPSPFIARMRELRGEEGVSWTAGLPRLTDSCASRFGLVIEAPFSDLSWNYVLRARQADGSPVVLKCSMNKEELTKEMNVLRAYAGRGAVAVIDADEELGAAVMQSAEPGTQLADIEDDTLATEIFCSVFRRLHDTAESEFKDMKLPSIKEHFAAIERYRERYSVQEAQAPLPESWVENAEECLAYLIASTEHNVLLHGDLHHYNILRQGDEDWAVIDPKGIIGDIHFDTIQYMLNYEDRGGTCEEVLERRIAIMTERLGLDPRRIGMWGVARGVLEACWSMESGEDWHNGIRITERFAKWID
ncbi:phosphotransferase [Paenibacillus rhizovicinus]|uniref:Phosphotransferase n=1 Tax=Paenibacillus rhizovicinus TaxID=2704463 RepID=A0A6C0NXR0_9BACL|nr:aminoglycoside phosphotransferase family protein [Paenibacillus rhizovicinus]QHW30931.1 phosphotransferase [Paenibacillus rhizovicinus]